MCSSLGAFHDCTSPLPKIRNADIVTVNMTNVSQKMILHSCNVCCCIIVIINSNYNLGFTSGVRMPIM
jgi:hypothetical protein